VAFNDVPLSVLRFKNTPANEHPARVNVIKNPNGRFRRATFLAVIQKIQNWIRCGFGEPPGRVDSTVITSTIEKEGYSVGA
jgi:hypothetical protein